jgi:XTP/dITP diphosphohydrolase
MKRLILASSNPGKLAELSALLHPIKCIAQQTLGITDADETGLSFIENACIKARHASRMSQQPALADDSGLVVPALNGQPGIYSARFAGINASDQANCDLLLTKLAETPQSQRQAYFYCAIVLVRHADDPTPLIATGQLHGQITRVPAGDQGFGYDPVFYVPEHHCTMAQLSPSLKQRISHRAKALNQLLHYLQADTVDSGMDQ